MKNPIPMSEVYLKWLAEEIDRQIELSLVVEDRLEEEFAARISGTLPGNVCDEIFDPEINAILDRIEALLKFPAAVDSLKFVTCKNRAYLKELLDKEDLPDILHALGTMSGITIH